MIPFFLSHTGESTRCYHCSSTYFNETKQEEQGGDCKGGSGTLTEEICPEPNSYCFVSIWSGHLLFLEPVRTIMKTQTHTFCTFFQFGLGMVSNCFPDAENFEYSDTDREKRGLGSRLCHSVPVWPCSDCWVCQWLQDNHLLLQWGPVQHRNHKGWWWRQRRNQNRRKTLVHLANHSDHAFFSLDVNSCCSPAAVDPKWKHDLIWQKDAKLKDSDGQINLCISFSCESFPTPIPSYAILANIALRWFHLSGTLSHSFWGYANASFHLHEFCNGRNHCLYIVVNTAFLPLILRKQNRFHVLHTRSHLILCKSYCFGQDIHHLWYLAPMLQRLIAQTLGDIFWKLDIT